MKNKLIMLINAWLGTFFKNKKPRYYDGIKEETHRMWFVTLKNPISVCVVVTVMKH
jgi:hypothetical protein